MRLSPQSATYNSPAGPKAALVAVVKIASSAGPPSPTCVYRDGGGSGRPFPATVEIIPAGDTTRTRVLAVVKIASSAGPPSPTCVYRDGGGSGRPFPATVEIIPAGDTTRTRVLA